MNRLNKTESVVFIYCRISLFLKDLFFQIFSGLMNKTRADLHSLISAFSSSLFQCIVSKLATGEISILARLCS